LDFDGHSKLINFPLVPKETAAVFPTEDPREAFADSALFSILYE
jgi:hypothetical protein